MNDSLIVLSIDATPSYALLARRCVESIRRAGTNIPIRLFLSEGASVDLAGLPNTDVVTIHTPSHASIYIENWYRLASVSASRVLALDVDTVCHEPLERLFEQYVHQDVYARVDLGSQRDGQTLLLGSVPVRPQIDWPVFLDQKVEFGVRDEPLFNTGVMLFNHRASRLISGHLQILRDAHDGWVSGQRPYPCTNRHIVEQLAASVMLGSIAHLTVGELSPEDAPFYLETRTAAREAGVITHIWTGLYRTYLREHRPPVDLRVYDEHRRRDLIRRAELARDGILPLRWST